ncbi:IS5 family transposase [Streptomyces sp. NPDC059153]|uniref:IS5 family transposase n=1 Tax=Streptomycetaceae TaxID=2062 RepID=UPI00332DFE2F
MSERKAYPSDVSDAQWSLIEPILLAWKAAHPSSSGHSGSYEYREIMNAIFYQNRTGCQWAYLPHDLPPSSATYYYFQTWRKDGTDQAIHDILRAQVRAAAGRAEDPSLVSMDTQSNHAAVNVPAATTGKDANKKVPGRKRGLAVDVIGLIIAVVVVAACVHDNAIGKQLLDKVAQAGTVQTALVDQGFKSSVVDHGADLGIKVEIVKRSPDDVGFVPQAKRWVSEQVNGILMLHRRLVRDYEALPANAESRVYWAITANMSRRLTKESTPTWRGA